MFNQPDLVGGGGIARAGEVAHRLECVGVVGARERPEQRLDDRPLQNDPDHGVRGQLTIERLELFPRLRPDRERDAQPCPA